MPKHVALRVPVRQPAGLHHSRPRPHRLPGHHRRKPVGVQRESGHRGRLPRQAQGAAQARRPAGGHRPVPHPDRGAGRPSHRTPARDRRGAAVRDRQRAVRRGPGRPRPAGRTRHRCGAGPRRGRGLPARGGRRALRRTGRRDPHAGTRNRRGAQRGGLRPHRHIDCRVRHRDQLAGRRRQHPDRQPGPPRRGDVRQPAHRLGAATRPRPAAGFKTGRWRSRVSEHPEALSEMPTVALAEEIETAGDGQVKAVVTIAGNPVLSAPDGARLERRPRHASTSWCRSTPTSTRRPGTPTSSCRRRRPRAQRISTSRSAPRWSATTPATPRRCCRCPTAGPTSARSCPGSP